VNVQTVITHNVPMQLSRDFLPKVSISDSSGRGWPKNPGLDSKGMQMDRGGDSGRQCVVRPCASALVHPTEDGGEPGGWEDQGQGGHSHVQRDSRDPEEVLGEEV
jgi:hypothetical protein